MRKLVNLWYAALRFHSLVHTLMWIKWRRLHQAIATWHHFRKSMILQL
jgi:hypothetical protein